MKITNGEYFKRWFQLSIRQKIQYSVSLFSVMVILVTGITFAWSAHRQFHNSTLNELRILASVLAGNSQAAVTFNDPASANRVLSALESNPNVLSATVYRNDEVFTVYPTGLPPLPLKRVTSDVWYESPYFYASQPIMVNEKALGTLVMKSQLIALTDFWVSLVYVMFGLLVAISGFAYLTSYWLKKHVTLPVRSLSEWATEVCSSKNFEARAVKHSDDEIGRLTDNLNDMLTELSKQESIISLNLSLEEEIGVRKKTEQELISMRNKAEEANRSKSMFLANMSHEIRTPMNAIIGFVDVVLEHDLPDELRKHLTTVRQSARDLHNLLNEILDVAKMEEGKLELERLPLSVNKVVSHVVKTLEFKAKEKNLQVIQRLSDAVPQYVLGDSLRLNQILMNLIGNAIKFTEVGSITVAVDVLETGELKFLVRDTGIGIPKAKVNHIFDSFNQADSSTNRKYGGTGLGTTISKQLVELMDGKIWVESEEGVGSSFYFTIRMESTDDPEHVEEHEFNLAKWRSSDSLNILVAEDMQQNADLLRIRLETLGHVMTHVMNGLQAVEIVKQQTFDLVLMDVQMPEMDGLEATRCIRSLEQGKTIPIIALTASVMHEDRHACHEAGMDGFVKNPLFSMIYFRKWPMFSVKNFKCQSRQILIC
ncbi:ATP-binding protein [Litoribacillus peritrichatus]|uniref:histidine kinase n=1 Tax=Litoribacillus peritrichatus TaxID=718191 RepID=A0ABP7M6R6_9GAMM